MSRSKGGRGRGRGKKRAPISVDRTIEEIEKDNATTIDANRNDGDESSSLNLSSVLFSHQTIYVQPSQIVTKSDGTLGFYIYMEHFPDDEPDAIKTTNTTNVDESTETSAIVPNTATIPTPSLPSIGFVKARTLFNPKSACLKNEITMLNEKIDDLDTEFQTIKVNLEFDSENMGESEKAELTFKSRDLTRALAVERSSVDSLKEQLLTEEEKGIAIVYSTACTEGRILQLKDILEMYVPPDDDVLHAEKVEIEEYYNNEINKINIIRKNSLMMEDDYEKDMLRIAELLTKKGELESRKKFRQEARWLETY